MFEIDENNSFQNLTENMAESTKQNNEVVSKDYERSQRAKQIAQDSNNKAYENVSGTDEWNLMLNALARIDYAVYESIDFSKFYVNPEKQIDSPLTNQQVINSTNKLEASYKNIYDKFINQYLNQTVDLPATLKSYLQSL